MRWPAICLAVLGISACAVGTNGATPSTGPSPTVTPQPAPTVSPDACRPLATEDEAIAREILSYETDEPIFTESAWNAAIPRANETLRLLRNAFQPAHVGPTYGKAFEVVVSFRSGPVRDQLTALLNGRRSAAFAPGQSTGIASLDDLDSRYRAGAVVVTFARTKQPFIQVEVCVDQLANFRAAVAEYRTEFPEAGVARGGLFQTDGPSLTVAARGGDVYAAVREAWGDCPSGCIYDRISVFAITGQVVTQLADAEVLADNFLLDLVASVRGGRLGWTGNLPAISPTPTPLLPKELPRTGGHP